MKKVLCLALTIILCLGLSIPAAAAGTCTDEHLISLAYGYCNANSVNVRTGPGTNYRSVGLANKGDTFNWYQTVAECHGTQNVDMLWCHVHGKHIGWMYGDYYTATEGARSIPIVVERA